MPGDFDESDRVDVGGFCGNAFGAFLNQMKTGILSQVGLPAIRAMRSIGVIGRVIAAYVTFGVMRKGSVTLGQGIVENAGAVGAGGREKNDAQPGIGFQ